MQQIFLIPIGKVDIDMLKQTIPPINKFLSDNVNAHISKILLFQQILISQLLNFNKNFVIIYL